MSNNKEDVDDDSLSTVSSASGSGLHHPDLPEDEPEMSQPLEPFPHQVGGHFPMVCLDESTVCKPLSEREHQIYQTMPESLRPFVPIFHGLIKVEVKEDEGGYIELTGHLPSHYLKNHPESATNKTRLLLPLRDSEQPSDLKAAGGDDSKPFCNPWALKCHRDHFAKLSDNSKYLKQTYLLLENVVRQFERPCVLDLKIGKRQYSDDCSEAKILRKIARANQTTTASLGLRLCGMQVYKDGKYVCLNKFDGRALTSVSFIGTMSTFLHNQNLIRSLRGKLQDLKSTVETLDSYRFYTCSLLVTYDATDPSSVDVRMIDFAHSTHSTMADRIKHQGPDDSFLQGLSSLLQILTHL